MRPVPDGGTLMLTITLIAAIACILLVAVGFDLKDERGALMAAVGTTGLLLLIVMLHAARIGAVVLR